MYKAGHDSGEAATGAVPLVFFFLKEMTKTIVGFFDKENYRSVLRCGDLSL